MNKTDYDHRNKKKSRLDLFIGSYIFRSWSIFIVYPALYIPRRNLAILPSAEPLHGARPSDLKLRHQSGESGFTGEKKVSYMI